MKKFNYLKISLFSFLLLCLGSTSLSAQVTYDNNLIATPNMFGSVPSLSNFTVPAGTDRLLVVVYANSNSSTRTAPTQISFGASNLQLGETSTTTPYGSTSAIFFLPLGSGPALTDDITGISAVGGVNVYESISAFTLQMVDQTNPISIQGNQIISNGNTTTSFNLAGTAPGSMIIESLKGSPSGTGMLQSGQNLIGIPASGPGQAGTALITYLSSPGGDVNLDWINLNLGGLSDGAYTAIAFAAAPPPIVPQAPIPTMSEWGLLIFGLLILNLGVFFVQRSELI